MRRVSSQSLASAVEKAGLYIRQCGRNHQQIHGGIAIVNVYGGKQGTTIYVQGTAKGRRIVEAKDAIDAATKVPRGVDVATAPRRRYRGVRKRKWKASRTCHWCGVEFRSFDQCTADHVIPLSKGGSNGDDNVVLACGRCNQKRKNNVTEQEIKSTRKPNGKA